jgi:hypothetical protein
MISQTEALANLTFALVNLAFIITTSLASFASAGSRSVKSKSGSGFASFTASVRARLDCFKVIKLIPAARSAVIGFAVIAVALRKLLPFNLATYLRIMHSVQKALKAVPSRSFKVLEFLDRPLHQ